MRKIVPGVKYTPQEIRKFLTKGNADDLALKGYVLRLEGGMFSVVHHTKAAMTGVTGKGTFEVPGTPKKRTPEQRVDSLMLKLVDDMKKEGGIAPLQSGIAPRITTDAVAGESRPATTTEREAAEKRLADEKVAIDRRVQEIVGEAWKAGRTEITGDIVRQVASSLLNRAERQQTS